MENTINVNEVVKTAVELEKAKTEIVKAQADAKFFEALYNAEKQKESAPKQIEVRVVKQERQRTWGGYETVSNVIDTFTSTAEEVVTKIKKLIDKNNEETIEAKEKELKALGKQLADSQESIAEIEAKNSKWYNKLADKTREEYNEKREKLEKKVAELKEELQKERENKSEAELERKTAEELAALISRLDTMQEELNELTGLTWLKRIFSWNSILNLKAKAKAYADEIRTKRITDDVIDRNTSFNYGW